MTIILFSLERLAPIKLKGFYKVPPVKANKSGETVNFPEVKSSGLQ